MNQILLRYQLGKDLKRDPQSGAVIGGRVRTFRFAMTDYDFAKRMAKMMETDQDIVAIELCMPVMRYEVQKFVGAIEPPMNSFSPDVTISKSYLAGSRA